MNNAARALSVVLFGLCLAPCLHAAPFAYIKHATGVTVVDIGSRNVLTEFAATGAGGVAIRAEVNRAYVTDTEKVTVIDTRAQAIVATAPLPTTGGPIVMRPGRPDAYVLTDHCIPNVPCTPDLS